MVVLVPGEGWEFVLDVVRVRALILMRWLGLSLLLDAVERDSSSLLLIPRVSWPGPLVEGAFLVAERR